MIAKIKHIQFFFHAFLRLKEENGMASNVDHDQIAPFKEQSDLGLHCLLSPICQNT